VRPFRFFGLVALLLLAGPGRADTQYFVAVFGAQSTPPAPNYTHTFAAFVKASGDGACPQAYVVQECFVISWLPKTLEVRTRALLPEPGVNLGLHETIKLVLCEKERVSLWGPFQIEQELFDRARDQVALLESGRVRYKALDSGHRSDRVSNCIHALGSCAEGRRVRILSPGFGETASWIITNRFRPWLVDPAHTHEWVFAYLKLDEYPIVRRDLDRNPRTGVFWSLAKTLVGLD
jgi:hypothetical protein